MLTILLTLLIVAVGLLALLWTGTLVAQGYIYDSPTDGLHWRAPAAAGLLTAFLFVWMVIEYRRPNSTDTIFNFSGLRSAEFNKFISVRKNEANQEQEIAYERQTMGPDRIRFLDKNGRVWERSSSGMMVAIVIDENGEKKRFNAEIKNGKFAPQRPNQPLRYYEEGGRRYIAENDLGKVYSKSFGAMAFSWFLNLVHLGLWFGALWPLLRFQWPHALGFAALCWLVVTLALLPYMFGRARDAAEKRQKKAVAMMVRNEQSLCAAQYGPFSGWHACV
jgi:hypothetical protein